MNSEVGKKIWITTDWEPNVFMGETEQLGRMNSLSKYLASKGYEVTLWFTTFSHPEKKHIFNETKIFDISDNERVIALHSKIIYKKNMSPLRIVYHNKLAKEMRKLIKDKRKFSKPDLIFCSYPTEQFCRVAIEYGKKNKVPVIVDARDQWPDIFDRAFPGKLRFIANIALHKMKLRAKKVFSSATAICAMSPVMLDWALKYGDRDKTEFDTSIFIGCKKGLVTEDSFKKKLSKFSEIGVDETTWNLCLFSSLSKTALDLDTVIDAVRLVHEKYPKIRLVIGGKGDDESRLLEKTKDIPYVSLLGWMNQDQMNSLMSISKVGLLCYRNTKDFKDGWGNKVGQYLSYGLPLLTSSSGFAKVYVEKYSCGIAYEEYDYIKLSEVLINLIENDDKVKELSRNSLDRYYKDFSEEVVMNKFETMINEVIDVYKK